MVSGLAGEPEVQYPGPTAYARKEQRKHARVGLRFTTQMLVIENGRATKPTEIHVRDISAAGMGIIHHKKMSTRSQFVIELPMQDGKALQVLCQVINCRPLDDQLFGIGASIISTRTEVAGSFPTWALVQQMHAEPAAAPAVPRANVPLPPPVNPAIAAQAAAIRKKMFDGQ